MNTLHHPAQLRTGGKPHENRTLHKALQTMAVFSWRFVAVPGGGKVTAQTALDLSQIRFFIHVNCPRWSKYAYQTNIFITHKIRNTTTCPSSPRNRVTGTGELGLSSGKRTAASDTSGTEPNSNPSRMEVTFNTGGINR